MKRALISVCALCAALSAFAYYGSYSYRDDDMSGFQIFTLIVMLAYIVLSIIILVRWWKMTSNVEKICIKLTDSDPQLELLIAIGEKEEAEKAAKTMLFKKLYDLYLEYYYHSDDRIESMNNFLKEQLADYKRLGINVPDHLANSGKFIEYMNNLTGKSFKSKLSTEKSEEEPKTTAS